ncbi:MAG: hypothetical protein JNL11_12170 [Bdellovibrionaceae bacterium]|nr:hypothetical protein [Pseudobdellovibrionaceae bacterium]
MHKIIFLVLLSAFVLGCAGPAAMISDSNVSLTETRKAIVKLYGEPRELSQNGREVLTGFMDKRGRVIDSAKKARERRFAHIKILGERRPYDVHVDVIVQAQLDDGSYDTVGDDERLANIIAADLKRELLKSLENRNIIDDFNAF